MRVGRAEKVLLHPSVTTFPCDNTAPSSPKKTALHSPFLRNSGHVSKGIHAVPPLYGYPQYCFVTISLDEEDKAGGSWLDDELVPGWGWEDDEDVPGVGTDDDEEGWGTPPIEEEEGIWHCTFRISII